MLDLSRNMHKIDGELSLSNIKTFNCHLDYVKQLKCEEGTIGDFVGSPKEIRILYFYHMHILSLNGYPKKCEYNTFSSSVIHSLEGLPNIIDGTLEFNICHIKDFKGMPKEVTSDFIFRRSTIPASLDDFPKIVGGNFYLYSEISWLLELIDPTFNLKTFDFDINLINKIERGIRSKIKVGGNVYVG